jgi:hypothetical protein
MNIRYLSQGERVKLVKRTEELRKQGMTVPFIAKRFGMDESQLRKLIEKGRQNVQSGNNDR